MKVNISSMFEIGSNHFLFLVDTQLYGKESYLLLSSATL